MAAERGRTRLSVPVEQLRERVAERRRAQTMREIAAEVGVSTTTVWDLLHGTTPQSRTHAKFAAWYFRTQAASLAEAVAAVETGNTAETAETALGDAVIELLTPGFPPEARDIFVRELRRIYLTTPDVDTPVWLDALLPRS